jgi:hypothetical protein
MLLIEPPAGLLLHSQFQTEHQRVRRILEEQFQAAVKRRDAASAVLAGVNRETPSGLPHPDGTQRIVNIAGLQG